MIPDGTETEVPKSFPLFPTSKYSPLLNPIAFDILKESLPLAVRFDPSASRPMPITLFPLVAA